MLVGLQHVKHVLPQRLLPRITDAPLFSHLRYCAQVYGSANCATITKLQKIINFSAKIISGRRRSDHVSDVLRDLGWLSALQHTAYFDMCLLNRVLNDGESVALRSQLSYNHEHITRVTRQSDHLCLPRPRNNHGKRAYTYRAVSLYNRHVIDNGAANLSGPMLKRHLRQVLSNSDV